MSNENCKVIVFGGCGFIGRNLVDYLIRNELASYIRVVDKVPPQLAWLNKRHSENFKNSKVEFISCNLINPDSVKTAFGNHKFDFAINCAGETKPDQSDLVYEEGIYKLSVNCAVAAAKNNVRRYIEISSGQMRSDDKKPHKESDKSEPWTVIAKYKLKVEQNLKFIENLNYTILRPGIIYGIGDRSGLVPRLLIGSIYKYLGEQIRLLWTKKLIMNTVHVRDVCRAIWYLAQLQETNKQIYNIVDDSCTTQGSLFDIISDIFNVNVQYCGNIVSTIFKNDMAAVVEEINEKHLEPWAEICEINNIFNTPLSPYINQELLYDKHLYLDNTKLKKTEFMFTVPSLDISNLLEILQDYVDINIFPKSQLF